MNIVRISLTALMAGVLTGCTYSVEADLTAGSAEAGPTAGTETTKAPGSFAEPFPERLFTMDRVSVAPAAGDDAIPDGPHHKSAGGQLTVTYRSGSGVTAGQQVTATGSQAQVSDLKGALDWLTGKAGKPAGARTDWVPVSPGSSPAAAACQNLAEGEGTRCYWVDADTVGYLHMSKEAAPYIPFGKTRIALEQLEEKR
ncbi:hypothetical protein Ppa06_32600 [Planomonospora parontospora subsp. parontospora]|uniref:Lipoprotein n=2 Tax=Planomonospora parontospora TaxID=58119 RepID=A0AA37BIB9_9ACTN|nr:hypothetical protein [Planomonospora parontospora]GGK75627.1 hypothetical protein GCM10010126_38500 [Planomonospora parontospora]GII09462.1 hypothetical protein Ppa06_32600 [Planomonospora parontospora subsp. parontospora]